MGMALKVLVITKSVSPIGDGDDGDDDCHLPLSGYRLFSPEKSRDILCEGIWLPRSSLIPEFIGPGSSMPEGGMVELRSASAFELN